MNITLRNKFVLFLFLICFFTSKAKAQQENKPANQFAVYATLGNGLTGVIAYNNSFIDNIFYSPSLRLLWKPNHLLNIGVESAYLTISKQDSTLSTTPFGTTVLKARLNAVPLLLVFNMKFSRIDLYYGIGVSYVKSRLQAFEEKVTVGNWYYCYDAAISYTYPLSKKINIGLEAKSYFFPKLQKISGGLVLSLSYRLLQW